MSGTPQINKVMAQLCSARDGVSPAPAATLDMNPNGPS